MIRMRAAYSTGRMEHMPSLTRAEAERRAAIVDVASYDVDLDLTAATTFRSRTAIRFHARGDETFAEVKPDRLISVRLNGADLDPAVLDGNRLVLTGLGKNNELVVEADMAYSNTGEGLHRFVDPADGRTYLYAMTFLDEAQRVFACFDQPDLKATFALSVTADPQWTVIANAPVASRPSPDRWVFAPTPPLATYLVTLAAGAYHPVYREHDGIPLGLFCRASLASYLDRDADELFAITENSFDRLHELFGIRYPFVKYDQAFVPEFNAGAMENPGCVTLRDDMVFRSAVTDFERERRAVTMAHEMAHMWFGDLVTMRWWDDLWLNESFAEYLGYRVSAAGDYPNAWATFAIRSKARGYAADQRPSTHPVAAADVADAAQALTNFDGISYAKGAAVLRQLATWVGDEAFLAGLRAHIAAHSYGNATLGDLLDALTEASGRDLAAWAEPWLRIAQVDTLRPRLAIADGHYESVAIEQSSPTVERPHRIGIGLYDRGRRRTTVDVDLSGGVTPVPSLSGQPTADLFLLNDGDLTYAKVRLDDSGWACLPSQLPTLEDPTARALLWGAVWDAVWDAERPAADYLTLMAAALPAERSVVILAQVLHTAQEVADRLVPESARSEALRVIAATGSRILAGAAAGGSHQLAAVRALVNSTVETELMRGWLAGDGVPDGLALDADLRWQVLHRLVVLGTADAGDIDAELARDRTAGGAEWAARCRASLPSAEAKERAWQLITTDLSVSNRVLAATCHGFWQPEQVALGEPYVSRYFAEMPEVAARRTAWMVQGLAAAVYPRFAVAESTRAAARELLARDDLSPALRRPVVDADDDLRRVLAARALAARVSVAARA